jgi:regulator of sigma E protease
MELFIKIAQFFLSLSLLIVLHEFGHFFFARLFKTRVSKFYLFFDFLFPLPDVLKFSLFKKKKGETEYGIGWFPFGGYVQIEGMVDENFDTEKLSQPAQPWEFRSKPAWQRLLIMLGGIIVNVLLAFIIYAGTLYYWGETKIINDSVKNGIWITDTLMNKVGFENGDKILAVNGNKIEYFEDIPKAVLFGSKEVLVERNGVRKVLYMPVDLIGQLVGKKINKKGLFLNRLPAIVGAFGPNDTTPAFKAGIKQNDKIVAIDSTKINFTDELISYLQPRAEKTVTVTVLRNDSLLKFSVLASKEAKIGIPPLSMKEYEALGCFKIENLSYSFLQAIPAGVLKAKGKLSDYIDQFKLIFSPKTGAYKGVGGFASMTQVFPGTWSWEAFWSITAFFSIALAFMNLLPIPALDGGHVIFCLFEMLTGKKPSIKFLEYAQMVGMGFIFFLLIYSNGNDIWRWLTGKF